MEDTTSPYVMQMGLRVLDHLGLRLYSNAAAVLSEAVANAWDADAKVVTITMSDSEIVIQDDGLGMDLEAINSRFLYVGYDKRTTEGASSTNGRKFMGRKGIGKLALFSIADEVEVCTMKGSDVRAFLMETEKIKDAVQKNEDYRPKPVPSVDAKPGTRITLRKLKKKRTAHSENALRKRIARRFSVIGYVGDDGDTFDVVINGAAVGPADRDDFKAVEFLWEFGEETIPSKSLPKLKHRFLLSDGVTPLKPDWVVRGWLGAASKPNSLTTDDSGLMNGLVVIARGRLIQENILDKLGFNRILASYITGQIEADFLDTEDMDDIATSDRQRLMEDDERYEALRHFLRSNLVMISDQWSSLRNQARGEEATLEFPALQEWLDMLPSGQRDGASRMLGVIKGVELEREDDRLDLFRSGMLAFERLRLSEASHKLADMHHLTADRLLPLLVDLASLEGSLYRDIVKSRLSVISQFEGLVDGDEKEKVLQEHLFQNLWLLDPGWERAAGSERIEQSLKKDYGVFDPGLTDEQSKGRIDIRYKTNAGEHILVELKRYKRRMSLPDLQEQGQKYVAGLKKCLRASGHDAPAVSLVFVLGVPIVEEEDPDLGSSYVKHTLHTLNARVIYYDQLIAQAREAYKEYLEKSEEVGKLEKMLEKLART